jgi:tetratricopeptide (TPR) repeat protein
MEPFQKYLTLAEKHLKQKANDNILRDEIVNFPIINEACLNHLSRKVEENLYSEPQLSFEIAHISRLAIESQSEDNWLTALAYFYEARAANKCDRPIQAKTAAKQAGKRFASLGRQDWAAASEWQFFEHPKIKGNIIQAQKGLQKALNQLERSSIPEFADECRLSLSTTLILQNQYRETKELLLKSQDRFEKRNDLHQQARCWWLLADLLRNEQKYDDANSQCRKAMQVFQKLQKPISIANCYRSMGMNYLYGTPMTDLAIENFEQADEIFTQTGLEIQHAVCQYFIQLSKLQKGTIQTNDISLSEAEEIFKRHRTFLQLADLYTTRGLLSLSRGDPVRSIQCFKKCQDYYVQLDYHREVINASINLGKAYRLAGKYQDALLTLEGASDKAIDSNGILTAAYANGQMAGIWLQLKDLEKSLYFIDQAIKLYQQCRQKATLLSMSFLRASILINQNKIDEALENLYESIELSIQYSLPQQTASGKRLLGNLFRKINELEKARTNIQEAETIFQSIGFPLDLALCKLDLAEIDLLQKDLPNAELHFKAAKEISDGIFDEIEWQSFAGLARIANLNLQPEKALDFYRQSIDQLQKIRENFWQSSLASTYSRSTVSLFSNALATAAQLNDQLSIVKFIESDKANSLIQQFKLDPSLSGDRTSTELEKVKQEISWLKEKLNAELSSPSLQMAVQNRQNKMELALQSKRYDELTSIIERQRYTKYSFLNNQNINLENIQDTFTSKLGTSWLAADYYVTESIIYLVVLSPNRVHLHSLQVTPRLVQAIENVKGTQGRGLVPNINDLRILGKMLLPESLQELLQPETRLIICPHGILHGLPWNAFQIGKADHFLVEKCVPVIIHSLRTASILLTSKANDPDLPREKGLCVGLSDFKGLYPPLPYILKEISSLLPLMAPGSHILSEEEATRQNLYELSHVNSSKGLSRFSFLHIASHFFSDSISGRLSGMSLFGEEIYQSQLLDLAPLPDLVTLSGCNSLFSLYYTGDEPVGLPSTCLVGGAKNVVGSFQPVRDEISARFMPEFYKNYFSGLSPAFALAKTQRIMLANSSDLVNWVGYQCVGVG